MLQHRLTRFALLLLVACVTAACDNDIDDGIGPDDGVARLRIVEVPAGERALVFSQQGLELDVAAARFEEDESYTAFLFASGLRTRAVSVPDTAIANANNNALRFINATSEAGDVYVTPPGTAPSAPFFVIGNSGPLALSNEMPSYLHRSVDHTQVRLFNVGVTTGSPRANFTLSGLPATRLGTVVFTEGQTLLVTPCP